MEYVIFCQKLFVNGDIFIYIMMYMLLMYMMYDITLKAYS